MRSESAIRFNFNRFCLDAYPSPFVVSLSNHEFSATPGSRFASDKLRTNEAGGDV